MKEKTGQLFKAVGKKIKNLMTPARYIVLGFLGVIAVFLCVAVLSRKVSLGSVTASLCLPAAAAAFSCPAELITMAGFAAVLVVFMHRSNIKRLISGKEPDFKPGKSV